MGSVRTLSNRVPLLLNCFTLLAGCEAMQVSCCLEKELSSATLTLQHFYSHLHTMLNTTGTPTTAEHGMTEQNHDPGFHMSPDVCDRNSEATPCVVQGDFKNWAP